MEAVGVPVLTEHVDIANVRLRFETGCIANLTASRISRERVRKLRFFQTDAYISVDCVSREVEGWRVTRTAESGRTIGGESITVPSGEPLERELGDFVNAISMGRSPLVDGQAGRRALALAHRVAKAMETTDTVGPLQATPPSDRNGT